MLFLSIILSLLLALPAQAIQCPARLGAAYNRAIQWIRSVQHTGAEKISDRALEILGRWGVSTEVGVVQVHLSVGGNPKGTLVFSHPIKAVDALEFTSPNRIFSGQKTLVLNVVSEKSVRAFIVSAGARFIRPLQGEGTLREDVLGQGIFVAKAGANTAPTPVQYVVTPSGLQVHTWSKNKLLPKFELPMGKILGAIALENTDGHSNVAIAFPDGIRTFSISHEIPFEVQHIRISDPIQKVYKAKSNRFFVVSDRSVSSFRVSTNGYIQIITTTPLEKVVVVSYLDASGEGLVLELSDGSTRVLPLI